MLQLWAHCFCVAKNHSWVILNAWYHEKFVNKHNNVYSYDKINKEIVFQYL